MGLFSDFAIEYLNECWEKRISKNSIWRGKEFLENQQRNPWHQEFKINPVRNLSYNSWKDLCCIAQDYWKKFLNKFLKESPGETREEKKNLPVESLKTYLLSKGFLTISSETVFGEIFGDNYWKNLTEKSLEESLERIDYKLQKESLIGIFSTPFNGNRGWNPKGISPRADHAGISFGNVSWNVRRNLREQPLMEYRRILAEMPGGIPVKASLTNLLGQP